MIVYCQAGIIGCCFMGWVGQTMVLLAVLVSSHYYSMLFDIILEGCSICFGWVVQVFDMRVQVEDVGKEELDC